MKRILKFILMSLIIGSCSSGGEDDTDTPEPAQNNSPSIPTLIYPTNSLLCIDNTLLFEWNTSVDSEGDAITYKIEVSKDNGFNVISNTVSSAATSQSFTLDKGVSYYWRVKAIDSREVSSDYSSVYNLYTESEGISNHLPFAPQLINPTLNSSIESGNILLEWESSDVDGDSLKYDIYFGSNNPPTTLISDNQDETTIAVTVAASEEYYWKIIVKDQNGGQSIGQIWKFLTN